MRMRGPRRKSGLPPYVAKHIVKGRPYYYYRRQGAQKVCISLKGDPYDRDGKPIEEWWTAYREASGIDGLSGLTYAPPGTFGALVADYKASPKWKSLAESTRECWIRHLSVIEEEWGERRVRHVDAKRVLELRDKFQNRPATANNLVRCLSAVLSFGVPRNYLARNPCFGVPDLKFGGGKPYDPWPDWAVETFKEFACPRLWEAVAVGYYTGQRLGDCLAMRHTDVEDGFVKVVQEKTGKELTVALHPKLQVILAKAPKTADTLLVSREGKAWTRDGFKTAMRRQMKRPSMAVLATERLVFHGLRKSAVVRLLECGCSVAEVMSITGQAMDMVEHYGRKINQRRLSAQGIARLFAAETSAEEEKRKQSLASDWRDRHTCEPAKFEIAPDDSWDDSARRFLT